MQAGIMPTAKAQHKPHPHKAKCLCVTFHFTYRAKGASFVQTVERTPMTILSRLAERGITLPNAPAPAANYVPFVQIGTTLYVSGQISQGPDGLIKGRLGDTMSVEDGAAAAQRCAISLLAQVNAACGGDLTRLKRVVKLTGFVNSTADFTDQPKVINGASDFLVEILGDAGRHARSAVSAAALPLGVAVEIEGIFELSA